MICPMAHRWVNAGFFTVMPTALAQIYTYAWAADQNSTPSVMRTDSLPYRSGRVASILIHTVVFPMDISTSLKSFGSDRSEAVCTLGEGLAEASSREMRSHPNLTCAFIPRGYADYDMNDSRQLSPCCDRNLKTRASLAYFS